MPSEPDQLRDTNHQPAFKKVPLINGVNWLTRALYLVKESPVNWFISAFLMIFTLLILLNLPIIQFFAIIVTPVFTAGFMIGCNNLEENKPFKVNQLFQGFNKHFNQLLIIGICYLAYTVICRVLALDLADSLGYPMIPITQEMIASGVIAPEVLKSLLLPMVIFLGLMIPIFMALWFSPALVVLNQVKPIEAIKQSLKAVMINTVPFIIFSLATFIGIILISIIATIISILVPALTQLSNLLLMLFLTSVTLAAMYTSFNDIFVNHSLLDQTRVDAIDEQSDNNDDPGSMTA